MGLSRHDSITYIAVIRHPLDVAFSHHNHGQNVNVERAIELCTAAVGEYVPDGHPGELPPEDLGDYLRWFIDNDLEPNGAGPKASRIIATR